MATLTEATTILLEIVKGQASPRTRIMAARALKDMGRANVESLGTLVRAEEDEESGAVVIKLPRIGLVPCP